MSARSTLARTTRHALVLQVAQLVEGDEVCTYCTADACLAIATGADPGYEAVCYDHGMMMMAAASTNIARLFGPK